MCNVLQHVTPNDGNMPSFRHRYGVEKAIVTFERRRINTFLQRVEVLYKTLKVVQNQTMERIATALL